MTALTRRRAAHSRDTCSFSSAGAVKTLVQVRVRAVRPEVGWPPKGSVKLERRRRRWWRPESRPEGVEPGQSRPPGACPAGAPPRVRPPCPPGWQLACCLVPEEIQHLAVGAEAKVRSPERGERWRPEAWRAPLQVCVRERPVSNSRCASGLCVRARRHECSSVLVRGRALGDPCAPTLLARGAPPEGTEGWD